MQSEQRGEMIGQVVFAAACPSHGHRALRAVENDGQLLQVEPGRVGTEFRFEAFVVQIELCRDGVHDRRQAVFHIDIC
ncbi:hypothetical protein D3C87_1571850 [compost metagenome]